MTKKRIDVAHRYWSPSWTHLCRRCRKTDVENCAGFHNRSLRRRTGCHKRRDVCHQTHTRYYKSDVGVRLCNCCSRSIFKSGILKMFTQTMTWSNDLSSFVMNPGWLLWCETAFSVRVCASCLTIKIFLWFWFWKLPPGPSSLCSNNHAFYLDPDMEECS